MDVITRQPRLFQGETHQALRKLIRLGYSRQVAAQFCGDMCVQLVDMVRSHSVGQSVSVMNLASKMVLRAIMTALTPMDLTAATADIIKFGNDVMFVVTRLRPSLTLWSPAYKKARGNVENILQKAIAEHRGNTYENEARTYMLDAFMASTTPAGDPMAERDLFGSAAYALCGTYIYVGRLVAFMMYELHNNPRLLHDVQQEVDAVMSAGPLDAAHFRRMKHLRGTFLEALRVYPLLPGLPFHAERDIEVNGFRIPKGQLVLCTTVPDQFLDEGWANPRAFDAERCMSPRREHGCPHRYGPFGSKPRTCAAGGMVEVVTLTTVIALLHQAQWALPRPTYRLELAMAPLIAPADGLPLKLTRFREPSDRTAGFEVLAEQPDLEDAIGET